MERWTENEMKNLPPKYGCELLLENASLEQLKDPLYPTDAYIVTYKIEDKIYKDLCRGSRVKIFDLYYDKFGSNVLQSIDWGYGRTNPKIWGIKTNNDKKKKR